MRGAPGTVQPGMGVRSLPCPPTRGVTGDSGNRAWPCGRRRSPVARVRLRGAARGAARSHVIRTPMLGPASSSLRLWGRLAPSDTESQGYPGASHGGLPNTRQLQPPPHSGLPVPPMYLAHFWMDRSPGSRRPGSRRWRRPGSQRARSPWLGRGPPAAGGAASRWTRRERHCSGRPLAPRAWGDRGGHPVKSPHRVGLSEGTEAPWALALSLWAMCTDPGVPGTQPASWRWKGGRLIRFHLGRVS